MDDLFTELVTLQSRLNAGSETRTNATLVKALNTILADTFSVASEAHGFHWNVKGQDFAQYHALFSEIYEELDGSVDTIAESILRLGFDAPFHLSEFMKLREVEETNAADTPESMATELLNSLEALIAGLNNGFDIANEVRQQGVANFLSERIFGLQKYAWQLRASLGIQLPNKLV
jgi:starvation-inducible DNA-binding protein